MFRIHKTLTAIAFLLVLAALPALAAQGVVNINTADVDELALLPRVGETVAQRIVDFREENGSFKAPEDLLLVKGIGDRTFELMEPHVTVTGETTLGEKVRIASQADGGEE